jgi:hypothetical protein
MAVAKTLKIILPLMETLSYHDLSLVIKFDVHLDFGNEHTSGTEKTL